MVKFSKHPAQKKKKNPLGVCKEKEVRRHKKPDVCRKQIVDSFCKKCPTLPAGEIGLLVVLPADKRGPPRIKAHNLTARQTIAAVTALNKSLPPHTQERLSKWVKDAEEAQQRKKRKSKLSEQQSEKTSQRKKQRVSAHASSGSDFSDAEEEDEAEEGSDVSQELDPHGCDSTGAVSEDWADSDSEQHITTDSNDKTMSGEDEDEAGEMEEEATEDEGEAEGVEDHGIEEEEEEEEEAAGGVEEDGMEEEDASAAGTGGTGHCGDSDYDQDVFDVTFAVLEAFEEDGEDTVKTKLVRKMVAKKLKRSAKSIKPYVKYAIEAYILSAAQKSKVPAPPVPASGTAPEGVNKACAAHSQPGSTVNRPPQPPPAPTAPMGKPRSTRIAANGAAAMLAQLRADEEVAEDMSGTGRGRGCKAAAALPGELKPQGALQAAAAQARTAKDVAKLYTQLASDIEKGATSVQQAQQDVKFAAAATKAVGGIWDRKAVTEAVAKAQVAVAKQQLMRQRA